MAKINLGNRTERRGHRPPHVPTEATLKQVEALTSYGVPQEHVASIVGIGEKTLRKHYADVLALAQSKANSLVAQSLFNRAIKGEGSQGVTAAIFWLKTRAGWRERDVHEITGADGGPIRMQADVAFAEFTKVLEQTARLKASGAFCLSGVTSPVLNRPPHVSKGAASDDYTG